MLNNSRTEPGALPPVPVTPSKSFGVSGMGTGLRTPQTGGNYRGEVGPVVPTPAALRGGREKSNTQATVATTDASEDEFYDWDDSGEEALEKVADEASGHSSSTVKSVQPSLPETPRKVGKTEALTSPGKRRFEDFEAMGGGKAYPTPATGGGGDDVFVTPSTGVRGGKDLFATKISGLSGADETPTPIRYKDVPLGTDSELASEILTALAAHSVALPADAREAVKSICNRHVLFSRGIMKGRDVSRAMVKSKEEKLVEMTVEVEGLRGGRETDRAVIRHLRREMAQRKEGGR